MNNHSNGEFSICRNNYGEIVIHVYDKENGKMIFEAKVTPDALGLALTGLSNVACTYAVDTRFLGKVREFKEIAIKIDGSEALALASFETEGWAGEKTHLTRRDRRSKDGYARVLFTRFVDAPHQ